MRIYLVGYMSAGKSTTAKRLANRLGLEAYDTDRMFEERYRISVNDFFQKYDEPLYRKLETQILHDTLAFDNAVIATGGGTPCFNDNMQWMLDHGLTVYLRLDEAGIMKRMAASRNIRPAIASLSQDERARFVHEQLQKREPYYNSAHLVFDAANPDLAAISGKIAGWISSGQMASTE